MRFSNLTSILALAASVQAWVIPKGATDGTYTVTVDARGVETHAKIANAGAEKRYLDARDFSSATLKIRSQFQIWCGCGFNMNIGNCDSAVDALKGQLGNVIPSGQSFYSIRGDVVAFACNRGSAGWLIDGHTYGAELGQITGACGRYIAGSRQMGNDGRHLIVGYMRYSNGVNFCADATSSPAGKC